MLIGIPKETLSGETRAAMLPNEIKRLRSDEIKVQVENDCGIGAFVSNSEYESAGIKIVDSVYHDSDVIIKINPPTEEELEKMRDNTILISMLDPFVNHNTIRKLAKKNQQLSDHPPTAMELNRANKNDAPFLKQVANHRDYKL